MTQEQVKVLPATSGRPIDLELLEKRAQSAVNGYTADVNITCYVYGQDVLALARYVRNLEQENRNLKALVPVATVAKP